MSLKKLLLSLTSALTLIVLVFSHTYVYTEKPAPPPGNTGAPGEPTCAKSGCHTGNTVTSLPNFISLGTIAGPSLSSGYTNGQVYSMFVNTNALNAAISGFSLTALDENDATTNAGTLVKLVNQTNTSSTLFNGRTYIGHQNADGTVSWLFQWEAPTNYSGKVFFYIAANKGNDDNTSSGDFIYTAKYEVTPDNFREVTDLSGIAADNIDNSDIVDVFPNPVRDKISIRYTAANNDIVSAKLFDRSGRQVQLFFEKEATPGHSAEHVNIAPSLSTGLYILRLSVGDKIYFKKLMVE